MKKSEALKQLKVALQEEPELLKKLFITEDIEVIKARLPQPERALGRLADVGQLIHVFNVTTIEQIPLSSLAGHSFNSAYALISRHDPYEQPPPHRW